MRKMQEGPGGEIILMNKQLETAVSDRRKAGFFHETLGAKEEFWEKSRMEYEIKRVKG